MNVEGHMMFCVVKRLRMMKKSIRKLMWSKRNIHDRVIKLRTELDATQASLDINPDSVQLHLEEKTKLQEFNEALLVEERFLKQKVKEECLRVGDSNSSYFHKVVRGRKNRNHIKAVFDHEDNLVEGVDVARVFTQHYELFLGTTSSCTNIVEPESLFESRISSAKVKHMVRPVTSNEVRMAMFDIGNDKAPGPDGYSSVFFKESWDIVG
ncbi:uncharacterized protein [Rutidosis leptorrhynchoides]|uniref:uncharacterized protein n=1 Tax=Rutidosis leptorrhynchoides TaxID=125765 RepID=UPI003A999DC5